jgi:shikimate kinase
LVQDHAIQAEYLGISGGRLILFGSQPPKKTKDRPHMDGPDMDARGKTKHKAARTEHQAQDPGAVHLRRSVVLVGMMGSGKTAVGKALAHRLGVPFLDSDAEIERAAQATIPEIFARDGEPFFRDREAEVIGRLLGGPPAIISTGGGAFMAERNRTAIAAHGVSVWLDAALDVLWDRVRHKENRPLLRTANPRETLAALFEARGPAYRLAGLRVVVEPGFSIEDTTARVIGVLRATPDILEPVA